ncbi:MAG: response regulator transcription factor [Candidatus Promineifilaceae bacterium]
MAQFNPSDYRILAVDDSDIILTMVDTALASAGFQVFTALSGEDALEVIKKEGLPHLALVDINMPFGMDGFELCEAVHEFCDLPIIMVTGVEDEGTIVDAIDLHAEDYIVKPFNPGELVARVRRVIRSVGNFNYPLTQPTWVDKVTAVDFPNQRLFVEDNEIALTATETKLLYILMRSSPNTLSSDYIIRRLWPLERAYEDRLRVYIHRLRQKMESLPNTRRYIFSVRGKGYLFSPDGVDED